MTRSIIRKIKLLLPLGLLVLLAGCASSKTVSGSNGAEEESVQIGTHLTVDAPDVLTLLDNKEVLAADGLYYATWTAGDSVPYENSEGDTIDLYDAQLYFLTSENASEDKASGNCASWLAAARENYDIQSEDERTFNGQTYTLLTYNCTGENNPYDRGVSAFTVHGSTAVCAELTCLENYTEDLETLLTDFLNGCHFTADEEEN